MFPPCLPKASEEKKYIFWGRSSSTLRAYISQTIKDINTIFGTHTYINKVYKCTKAQVRIYYNAKTRAKKLKISAEKNRIFNFDRL